MRIGGFTDLNPQASCESGFVSTIYPCTALDFVELTRSKQTATCILLLLNPIEHVECLVFYNVRLYIYIYVII